MGLTTGPRAHEARPTLNHATSACGAQAATSARRSLRPAALPTAGSIHPSPTHPATPLAYSNSRAREYQARAARVAVRGFHMFAVTGSVPSAGSVSHHRHGLQTSFLARSASDNVFWSRDNDNAERNVLPARGAHYPPSPASARPAERASSIRKLIPRTDFHGAREAQQMCMHKEIQSDPLRCPPRAPSILPSTPPPRLHSRVVSQGNNKRAQRTGWCLGSTPTL